MKIGRFQNLVTAAAAVALTATLFTGCEKKADTITQRASPRRASKR